MHFQNSSSSLAQVIWDPVDRFLDLQQGYYWLARKADIIVYVY